MKRWRAALGAALVLMTVGFAAAGPLPAGATGAGAARRRQSGGPRPNVGAADRHRVDPAAADRGRKIYAAECVTCHGPSARGTERGANLVRSPVVLRDRYGSSIGPFLKKGHPMQTARPSASLTDAQITDLSHFIWQRINDTLRGSPVFEPGDVLAGDAKAGEAYFNGEGRCATCHSLTGDLAGYGKRFPPVDIQQRFVFPNTAGGRGAAAPRARRASRSPSPSRCPTAPACPGPLVSMDDFHVALRTPGRRLPLLDAHAGMKIVKTDPLAAHVELLDRLTDKAMHDVVAYLETLK